MRRVLLTTLFAAVLPLASLAQDDMYFSPKKDKKASAESVEHSSSGYGSYSGCNRDVDEYNRRGLGSSYQIFDGDSLNSDVIDFYGATPDSVYGKRKMKCELHDYTYGDGYDYDNSYAYRMRYFDDLWFYDPWFYGPAYYSGWYGYCGYGWGWPWHYGWYGGWYDPWYYGYTGWYDPWRGPWGWSRPYWGNAVVHNRYNGGVTGSSNHGWVSSGTLGNIGFSGSRRDGNSNFSGYRGSNSTSNKNVDAYNRQNSRPNSYSGYRRNDNGFGNEQYRQQSVNYDRSAFSNNSPYRNSSSFDSGSSVSRGGSFSGGGGFGGGHSGGFSGGGRSGGGGHFGGRR